MYNIIIVAVCPQDIGVSKDLNEQFRRHLTNSAEPLDIDFSIQVLSSGSWPFQQSFTFSLPTEVNFIIDRLIALSSNIMYIFNRT